MQVMSWLVARMGSRFSLLFEPHRRRVVHSALGRFLDQPLDLMVGLVEPDGTERVLPFTGQGSLLYCPEQFERINSITFRAYSENYGLYFEFNVHNVFYPQDESLCTTPAFYIEMRISPAHAIGWMKPKGPTPRQVTLFIRLNRPDTLIQASSDNDQSWIDLSYRNTLVPDLDPRSESPAPPCPDHKVQVHERIVSLNRGCAVDPDGRGLTLDLPVTEVGSGIKWRLVWGAHCGEPIMEVHHDGQVRQGTLHYVSRLADLDAVIHEAIELRDDRLAHSRRFEKLFDQAPLRMAQRHLLHQSFQCFLGNMFWCDLDDGRPWFSTWDGQGYCQSSLKVEYHAMPAYMALWPELLTMQLDQWAQRGRPHEPSSGVTLPNDLGRGLRLSSSDDAVDAGFVTACANFLLMLQVHVHWTGDRDAAGRYADLVEKLLAYLVWVDRDSTGFVNEPTAGSSSESDEIVAFAGGQTGLAIKRLAAIRAAGDLLAQAGRTDQVERCEQILRDDANRIQVAAWMGDHYAACSAPTAASLVEDHTGQHVGDDLANGLTAYSISTGDGLLLGAMIGQPWLLDPDRLRLDLTNATRETLGPYGCGQNSTETQHVRVSHNIWRDHLACYLGLPRPHLTQRYWDMQVLANTADLSSGFVDSYLTHNASFHPAGAASLGFMLAQVRLVIDRLAPGGHRISVEPDTTVPQRWPLLPLADWKAGRIPVCVVDEDGCVTIENESDPVIVHGPGAAEPDLIG